MKFLDLKILIQVVLFLAGACQAFGGGVQVLSKSLKDATHIELSGLSEWRYEVSRKKINDKTHVSIQLTGVSPSDVAALRAIHDPRLESASVKEGLNGDALVEFTLADNQLGFFDYQTEAPASLILDIYKEDPKPPKDEQPKTAAGKKIAHKPTRSELLSTLVAKAPRKTGRHVASVDHPEIGSQPLLADAKPNSQLELKYGIFDGGDQNLMRFKIDDKEISEAAQIKSERDMFLHFPILTYNQVNLGNLLEETPNYDIQPNDSDENQQVRLIIKLFNENKMAVALRTLKFFNEKYPQTTYQKTLDFVTAETYLKLWKRDHNRADFEEAMARFKEILNHYPEDPTRYRTLMLIGMNYLSVGNNFGALSTFEVGVKSYPDSPYFWQMRMEIAEALNALDKFPAALKELEDIENSPLSKAFGIEARYRRGDVYFRSKDYTTAVKEYDAAIKKYPDQWRQGPNAYFNAAESDFWLKDYKGSLEKFREFLQRFPLHNYGGYAMTRIGEILQILGASHQKTEGAYLESYFRYHDSPGAYVAKIHINTSRYASMKDKEIQAARDEIKSEMAQIQIPDIETFVTLQEADGFWERKKFDTSQDMLVKFYQSNILSPYLPLFKYRIGRNITSQMDALNQKHDYIKSLESYIKNEDSWLKGNDRIDTRFYAGQAYEALNVPVEAAKFYDQCLKMREELSADQLKRAKIFESLPTADQINLRLAQVSLKGGDIRKTATYLSAIKDVAQMTDQEQIERSLILSKVAEKEEKPDLALLALTELSEHWKSLGKGQDNLMVEPWLRMARINSSLKKYSDALPWAQKAVKAAVENGSTVNHDLAREALDLAADLYLKSDKPVSAIDSYKTYVEKFSDQGPVAPIKYKLGKLYFDQKNYQEASRVWASLKDDSDGELWDKMAKEQLAQAQWSDKYYRYIDRKPAGENK